MSDSPWAIFGFTIALQVRHPRLGTDKVSKALRLRPKRARVAGEPRATPKDTPLPGVYEESHCYYELAEGLGGGALEERLGGVARRLAKHSLLLRSWRRSGGKLALYVTVHGEAAMGFSIAPDLLSELGRLGIELGIEALRVRQRS